VWGRRVALTSYAAATIRGAPVHHGSQGGHAFSTGHLLNFVTRRWSAVGRAVDETDGPTYLLRVMRWLRERFGRDTPKLLELDEPFRADVVLDGVVVATLSERVPDDMFWRRYRIAPFEGSAAIYDDELWNRCRFTFRDPMSGKVCACGFAGGKAPFVRDGRVRLRGMYFGDPAPLPRATVSLRKSRN
jgi:hypothetical protein